MYLIDKWYSNMMQSVFISLLWFYSFIHLNTIQYHKCFDKQNGHKDTTPPPVIWLLMIFSKIEWFLYNCFNAMSVHNVGNYAEFLFTCVIVSIYKLNKAIKWLSLPLTVNWFDSNLSEFCESDPASLLFCLQDLLTGFALKLFLDVTSRAAVSSPLMHQFV